MMIEESIVKNLSKKIKLDNYVSTLFPTITRSISKKIILNGFITLNYRKVRPNHLIDNEDSIFINYDDIRNYIQINNLTELKPIPMDLKIVFEDINAIVIDKSSGVVVHPVYKHLDDTLMNGLIYYIINQNQDPFINIRPVHRLDKDTSGIILFSKNLEAHQFYAKQFKKRMVKKTYLAIVKGNFKKLLSDEKKTFINIKNKLSKKPKNTTYYSTSNSDGEDAETDLFFEKFMDKNCEYSLIKVLPKTGRTHQIRIHLGELGFPIVGDTLYGGEESSRLMLHAWKLKILFSEKEKEFIAQIPDSFKI